MRMRLLLFENFLSDACRRNRGRPSRIEGKMGDEFAQLVLGHAVFQCTLQMNPKLIGPLQCDQGRASDQAAVTLRKSWTVPYVAEQDFFGEIDQFRHYCPDALSW